MYHMQHGDDSENAFAVNVGIGQSNGKAQLNANLDMECHDNEAEFGGQVDAELNANVSVHKPFSNLSNAECDIDLEIRADKKDGADVDTNFGAGIDLNGCALVDRDVDLNGEAVMPRKVIEVNKDFSKIPPRDPDIHIRIDMDEINKTANFFIDVPDKWSKKLINKWDEPKYRSRIFNENINCDTQGREKERLDVEINMFIGKENLEDSTVYALINPINLDENVNNNKYDFKFQLPKFPSLSFRGRPKTDENIEVDVPVQNIDINDDLNIDSSTKRRDFRFQLPKIDFPSLSFKGKPKADGDLDVEMEKPNVDVDMDVNAGDVDIERPTKRADFRFKLPKVDLSILDKLKKSPNANLEVEIDGNEDEIRADVAVDVRSEMPIESPTKRYDFRYQLPKIEFPSLARKESLNADADIDVNSPNVEYNADGSVKRRDFIFQLPSIEFPTLIYKPKSHNAVADIDVPADKADINADLELEEPVNDFNIESPFKKYDFQFKFPTIDLSLFGKKHESEKLDGDVEVEVHLNNEESGVDLEINSPTKRHDFRYQLPKLEFSSLSFKGKRKVDEDLDLEADVDANINDDDKEIKSTTQRPDLRFKLPKLEFNLFGQFKKSGSVDADLEVNVNEDEIHPEDGAVLRSELEIESPDKKRDFQFNLPKINFSSLRFKGKDKVESANDTQLEANGELDEPKKRHDFRFQLPKVELPSFRIRQKIDTTQTFGLHLHEDTQRYDFSFSYPAKNFDNIDGKVVFRDDSAEHDIDYNEFSIKFDEGDSNRTNDNIFQIILKNGNLKCFERHNGELQETTFVDVDCFSPSKNWLVVFLPIGIDSDVVIVFNETVVLKYRLQGSINTLRSFDLEGSVKLNAAKLFGE